MLPLVSISVNLNVHTAQLGGMANLYCMHKESVFK